MSTAEQYVQPQVGPGGLVMVGSATGDFHIQSTEASLKKQEQFEQLRSRWAHGDRPRSAGGQLIISLALHDAVLDQSHVSAISRSGEAWSDGVAVALEWRLQHGWRDRRHLSDESAACLQDNGGVALTSRHWADAAAYLRTGSALGEPVVCAFFDAATAYWYFHLPGLLFCHCLRLAPLQPLSRDAHARRVSGRPLLPVLADSSASRRSSIEVGLQMARRSSSRLECVHRIRQMFRRAVVKSSEQKVRQQWIAGLVTLFDEACSHGRAQALVVAGTLHVVEEGGIRGELLKPSSLVSYIGDTVERLLKAMLTQGGDPDGYTADTWHRIYAETTGRAHASLQGKAAAFLAAFHRMLVGRGAEPLTRPIGQQNHVEPPAARTLFDVEFERARAFVQRSAANDRVRMQAELMLLIGKAVAIRTSEIFTLRIEDLQEGRAGVCVLSIAPRLNDGTSKTPAVRRQVEIHDIEVIEKLLAFRRRRLGEDAASSDYLFGEPRRPGERHDEEETTKLVQQAIKSATGDPESSFYCLRHRVLSDQVEAALMPDAKPCDEPRLLNSIAGRAGHASIASSRPYINQFEAALQAWAARNRGSAANAPTHGFKRVEHGIALATSAGNSPEHEFPAAPSAHKQAPSAETVIAVLDDVARDHSPTATALRNNLSVSQAHDIVSAAFDVLSTIRLGPTVCSAHRQLDATSLVQSMKVWWRASAQPKYETVRRRLTTIIEDEPRFLDRLTRAWQVSYRKQELSLDHYEATTPLLEFLRSCKVPASRLLITCAQNKVPAHLQARNGRDFVVHLVPARAGRAQVRLHLCSVDASVQVPAGPAIGVQGLHAWMVAAAICQASRGAT